MGKARRCEGVLNLIYLNNRILLKTVHVLSPILKHVGYIKLTLAMDVLHNLHGELSQWNYLIFFLNVDRDGASLIFIKLIKISF